MRRTCQTRTRKDGLWRSGHFSFNETYSVDARDGVRVYARLIPELEVVGIYKDEQLLFSMTAENTYHWASNLSILTVNAVASDEDKDAALEHIATEPPK